MNGNELLKKFIEAQHLLENGTIDAKNHYYFTCKYILSKIDEFENDAKANLAAAYAVKHFADYDKSTKVKKWISYLERYVELAKQEDVGYCIYRWLADYYYENCEFLKAAQNYEKSQLEFDKEYYKSNIFSDGRDMNTYMLEHHYADIRASKVYLKAGTEYAVDFWLRQQKSVFYNTSKCFKEQVDRELKIVLEKQKKGYVYKSQKLKRLIKRLVNTLNFIAYKKAKK